MPEKFINSLSPYIPAPFENANVCPHYGRGLTPSQGTLTREESLAPQRLQKPAFVDPEICLSQVAEELTAALALADAAPAQYEAALNAPPKTEKADAEAKVAKLAAQLREAQAVLDDINRRPTPLQAFTDTALSLESTTQALAGLAHTALVDRDVKRVFSVTRDDAAKEVLYTFGRKYKRLSVYGKFQNLWRAVEAKSAVSGVLVSNSVKRSKAALEVIAEVLKGAK
jgi:hypothetical protein